MVKNASFKNATKEIVRSCIPLAARKQMAVWVNHQGWLDHHRRSWWSQELVRDLSDININEYHKFLWSNHLSYAATYEIACRFGRENMKQSRRLFFEDLNKHLTSLSVNPGKDVRSVFEVGCSLGYQLRYLETDVFSSATTLEGIDIDARAIHDGTEYLRGIGSTIRLHCADMEELEGVLEGKRFDVIICSGVLMYLDEDAATRVVDTLLRHTGVMLAFAGLAHPYIDNAQLSRSVPRDSDKSLIHNIDAMINKAGGRIAARRWGGSEQVDGHTIYFVFATTR